MPTLMLMLKTSLNNMDSSMPMVTLIPYQPKQKPMATSMPKHSLKLWKTTTNILIVIPMHSCKVLETSMLMVKLICSLLVTWKEAWVVTSTVELVLMVTLRAPMSSKAPTISKEVLMVNSVLVLMLVLLTESLSEFYLSLNTVAVNIKSYLRSSTLNLIKFCITNSTF